MGTKQVNLVRAIGVFLCWAAVPAVAGWDGGMPLTVTSVSWVTLAAAACAVIQLLLKADPSAESLYTPRIPILRGVFKVAGISLAIAFCAIVAEPVEGAGLVWAWMLMLWPAAASSGLLDITDPWLARSELRKQGLRLKNGCVVDIEPQLAAKPAAVNSQIAVESHEPSHEYW